ncbi:hypothetical protein ACHQM5_010621 [Ranunculus cassubicifolius]
METISRVALFFSFLSVFVQGQNLLSCETNSPDAFGYSCKDHALQTQCNTYAMLYTNSHFSSLSNLSLYLGLDRKVILEASGISTSTEFLPRDQPLLIPIHCKCSEDFFGASLTKTTVKGDSFYGISESLEGLTTCKAIQEKNPGTSPWGLADKMQLLIPLRCSCPSESELKKGTKFLISYPINEGDAVSNLASQFNITIEAIVSANERVGTFKSEEIEPYSTLLIPLTSKPLLTPFSNPREPSSGIYGNTSLPISSPSHHHSRTIRLWKIGVSIAVGSIVVAVCVAAFAVILVSRLRKTNPNFCKSDDVELQHLSIRTRSEIKTISESSFGAFDVQALETTPHKMAVESYTIDELKKATEEFNSSNFIEGTTFHGRLSGKNLAIKRTKTEAISKIEFELFQEAYQQNPSIIHLLGTCLVDGPDSFLVFEYAKNGSLKDWLHGGLAMKSQFIASCYCFLTWNQRIKICLDIAVALEYMHHIMIPSYVHRDIKSRNIFLDEEFNAKIGNFGMGRCIEDNKEDSASWDRGYLAPECLKQGAVSSSADIFAYGVILLEVLSGQPPIVREDKKGEEIVLLSDKFKSILRSDDCRELKEFMDSALGDAYSFDMAVALAYLARSCVLKDPSCRPKAGHIVEKLTKLNKELSGEQSLSRASSSSKTQAKV